MRVLILGGITGSGGFLRHLGGILAPGLLPRDVEVVLLCSEKLFSSLGAVDSNVQMLHLPGLENMSRWNSRSWWRCTYPAILSQVSPSVVFDLNGYTPRPYSGIPLVVMSQNSLPFDLFETFRYIPHKFAAVLFLSRLRHARAFRHANGVIFVSEYARQQISRSMVNIKRSAVIYHGLDDAFVASEPRNGALREPIELLYVSSVHLYKYHCSVVKAIQLLREKLGCDVRLTLVGGGEPVATARLRRQIEKSGASSYVRCLGDVNMEGVLDLYKSADIFVFASSCEAFGLALLEAMGSGLPIACSNRSAMPEFLGDGGVYFDPKRVESIVAALSILITDAKVRRNCAYKAWLNAKKFTWRRCSAETFDFLRAIASN